MNRLYLLGALALSEVSAYIYLGSTIPALVASWSITFAENTYTGASDCFTTGTATTLGMNNIYYQYYSFTVAAGTQSYSTTYAYDGTSTGNKITNAVTGCTHEHLYNWMAQPVIGSSAISDGISDALVAYGYVMEGSTLAACTLKVTAVTTTLFTSTIFTGSRFQYVSAIVSGEPLGAAQSTTTATVGTSMLTHYGVGALQTVAATVQPFTTISSAGMTTTTANNFYYDFAQQQVVQGQTQFGRGGVASTAPCGWWVFYAHEGGVQTSGTDLAGDAWNSAITWQAFTVHMWTDNALMNTIGAFTIATLAALY